MKATAQVFLSYAREDEEKVEDLYRKLSDAGFKPWMDKKDILPGEKWGLVIQKAIRGSDFFLVCLSANSVSKRGVLQKEIKKALDMWQEMLEDDIYLIPVRLEDCEAPESLHDFQWVNLFEEDGWTRLVKAIQVGIERLKPIAQESMPFERRRVSDNSMVGDNQAVSVSRRSSPLAQPQRRRLEREKQDLETHIERLSEKISDVRHDLSLETRSDERRRLKAVIEDNERLREELEAKLDRIEMQLG